MTAQPPFSSSAWTDWASSPNALGTVSRITYLAPNLAAAFRAALTRFSFFSVSRTICRIAWPRFVNVFVAMTLRRRALASYDKLEVQVRVAPELDERIVARNARGAGLLIEPVDDLDALLRRHGRQ